MKKDIISRALEGVKDEYIAEAAQYRAPEIPAEPVCTPARFKKSRFARRAAVAACLAAAVALGAVGAALLNNAPDPAESIAPAQTADDVPRRIPSADQAASDDEPYTDPYVNGVFIPYIYVNNLFRGMDVIKMYVPKDYATGSLNEGKIIGAIPGVAAISAIPLAGGSVGGKRPPEVFDDPREMNPIYRQWPEIGTLLYFTEGYPYYISPRLAIKMHYFPEEEKYATLLRFNYVLYDKEDKKHAVSADEAAKYVYDRTGETLDIRPVQMYIDDFTLEGYEGPVLVGEGQTFFGTLTAKQITALAEACVSCFYVTTGIGDWDDVYHVDDDVLSPEFRRDHRPNEYEYSVRVWYNRLIDDPNCLDEKILKALKTVCELGGGGGGCYRASEDGIHMIHD